MYVNIVVKNTVQNSWSKAKVMSHLWEQVDRKNFLGFSSMSKLKSMDSKVKHTGIQILTL